MGKAHGGTELLLTLAAWLQQPSFTNVGQVFGGTGAAGVIRKSIELPSARYGAAGATHISTGSIAMPPKPVVADRALMTGFVRVTA
jgi:hypothetical protein